MQMTMARVFPITTQNDGTVLSNIIWLCRNAHESKTQANMMNNGGFFMVKPSSRRQFKLLNEISLEMPRNLDVSLH